MPFPVVCIMPHNSSWLESYGHEKLETLGLGNAPKFSLMGNGMIYDIFLDNTILYG